ncbi:DUF3566 domain-containing protein [Nakamurella deserti]|uniref:DUF3566 domain-containing protein n=1 Tax=Nakamurella deserti TaxID=2164074 RepID=UPI000DBE87BF|nr:DUF3566 domain-containing protein [Nakamurella deserti]
MSSPEQQSKSPVTAVGPGAARGTEPAAATAASTRTEAIRRPGKRAPRITTLQLKRLDPWTTLKVSLIVSIVMFFVWMIAVGLLYVLFSSLDVVSRINAGWATVTSADSSVTPSDLITAGKVFGIAAVIGAINIVILTALATVASFVYNAAAGMAGGVELTLGERD